MELLGIIGLTHAAQKKTSSLSSLFANSMTFHNLKGNPMTFQGWKTKIQIPQLSRFSMTGMHPARECKLISM
jgi:hypothetical protein